MSKSADHTHDEMCKTIDELRAKLVKTQKEKIALLEEKLCGLCEEDHPEDERHDELKAQVSEKTKEVEHLRNCVADRDKCIATGRGDGTGTDYPAELKKARKERGDLQRRNNKLEKSLSDVCISAANRRLASDQEV